MSLFAVVSVVVVVHLLGRRNNGNITLAPY
jgi:hypothetical protein